MDSILSFLQGSSVSDIIFAVLAVIGGLKVIARYTPWTADDHFLEVVEKPILVIRDFFFSSKGQK